MTDPQAIVENLFTDVCFIQANLIRADGCRPGLAVPFKQMCLEASRNARKQLEQFERQIEDELFSKRAAHDAVDAYKNAA